MSAPRHVVMFSGGRGSYAAALRVAERHGTDGLVLLFADVRGEDEDTYRFLVESAADVLGIQLDPVDPGDAPRLAYAAQAAQVPALAWVVDGRTIWDVFRDKRYLGNSRIANCSAELKQKPSRAWLDEHADPSVTTIHVGIDWSEQHRLAGVRHGYAHPADRKCTGECRSLWDRRTGARLEGPGCRHLLWDSPWRVEAPLCDEPYVDAEQFLADRGVRRPRLYDLGFAHGNCGGGCVRSGMGAFLNLLEVMPERYAEWEANEEAMRTFLGKDVTIVREWPKEGPRPITLQRLRERQEARNVDPVELLDVGGCGCFVDDGTEAS